MAATHSDTDLDQGGAKSQQPLLSVIVPAYNSEEYLDRCLETLVDYQHQVEVIVVNDGSTDGTQELAEAWAKRYPQNIRVCKQENKGHGGALNTGIAAATGLYLKVVDSDDWVNREAMETVLAELNDSIARGETLDMLVTNYVYEKQGRDRKAVMRYRNALPVGRTVGWESLGRLRYEQYLMMHAVTFRTQVVRDSGLRILENTFYVDFIYSFVPLPYVKTLRYVDVDLYRYFIGRDDQSVNEKVMITRTDQLQRVNNALVDAMPRKEDLHPRLFRYMIHYMRINFAALSVFLILAGSKEHLEQRELLWAKVKNERPDIYRSLSRGPLGRGISIPGRIGQHITIVGYRVSTAVLGFN
ncbi:glycosyltransferase [Gleimia sp. 6138-11-ORH1]|uniref:glycosyltransferase n=1 Tax=Gleimia sp. 6138-11-ORH1 TaxID=2973937 RepID=UPI0037C0BF0A